MTRDDVAMTTEPGVIMTTSVWPTSHIQVMRRLHEKVTAPVGDPWCRISAEFVPRAEVITLQSADCGQTGDRSSDADRGQEAELLVLGEICPADCSCCHWAGQTQPETRSTRRWPAGTHT